MLLIGILFLALSVSAAQQTYQVIIRYTTLNCVANTVYQFDAIRATGACTAVACNPDGNGGSREVLCPSGSTPIPPNTLVCPTCYYCGSDLWTNNATCAGSVDHVSRASTYACVPTTGAFTSYTGCNIFGGLVNQTFYTDAQCTNVLIPANGNGAAGPCVPSASPCISASPSSSRAQCGYGSSPPATSSGSILAASSTLLIVAIVALVLTQ
jgi:hypothetical protein